MRVISLVLLGLGIGSFAFAGSPVPEIDPTSGASALSLLAGAFLLFRAKSR
jgi:uncharacterized membrane protein YdcZ (DUF606 family)